MSELKSKIKWRVFLRLTMYNNVPPTVMAKRYTAYSQTQQLLQDLSDCILHPYTILFVLMRVSYVIILTLMCSNTTKRNMAKLSVVLLSVATLSDTTERNMARLSVVLLSAVMRSDTTERNMATLSVVLLSVVMLCIVISTVNSRVALPLAKYLDKRMVCLGIRTVH